MGRQNNATINRSTQTCESKIWQRHKETPNRTLTDKRCRLDPEIIRAAKQAKIYQRTNTKGPQMRSFFSFFILLYQHPIYFAILILSLTKHLPMLMLLLHRIEPDDSFTIICNAFTFNPFLPSCHKEWAQHPYVFIQHMSLLLFRYYPLTARVPMHQRVCILVLSAE